MNTSPPPTALRLAGYAAFILIGWNSVLLSSLIRSVEPTFQQSDAAFGLLYFLASVAYAAGALGGAFVTERMGRHVVLPLGLALIGVGLLAEGLAPVWVLMLAASMINSLGGGAIDGGIQGLFLDLFQEARGGAMNLLHVFFSVGALFSPLAAGLLITAGAPWRAVVIASAIPLLLLAAWLRSRPMPSGRHQPHLAVAREVEERERSLVPFVGLAIAICCYVASEVAVSSWTVKYLSGAPVAVATGVLSAFWAGMALGRLLSGGLAERFDYAWFVVVSVVLMSLTLAAAVMAPWLGLAALLFALTGLWSGPIYPTIMALGGNLYPHRLAALSGSLSAAAVVGSVVYPPLMGILEQHIGLRGGLLGAALLGLPAVAGIALTQAAGRRVSVPSIPARSPPLPRDRRSQGSRR